MCKITVIDSPCGAGKTQKMIEMMNTNNNNHYIYRKRIPPTSKLRGSR